MTTAEKLTRLKTDLDEVYTKGYEKGKAEGGGTWDFTKYLASMRLNTSVVEITDNIYFDLSAFETSLAYFASNVPFSCEKITVKLSDKITSIQQAFSNVPNAAQDKLKEIEIIGSTAKITNFANAFCRTTLERITGEIDFSSCNYIYRCFYDATSLKELRIKPNSIKISISFNSSAYLTLETIQSIIDGLADMTGADTSPVLTLNSNAKANLTEEQISTITGKNWTLA